MTDLLLDSSAYHAVFDAADDAIVILDRQDPVDCNAAALQLWDMPSRACFLHTEMAVFLPPNQPDGKASAPAFQTYLSAAFDKGSAHFDWVFKSRTGDAFRSEVRLNAFRWQTRQLLRMTVRRMTSRRTPAEQSVDIPYAYFKSLFNSSPDGIVVVDDADRIIDANYGFERLFGCECGSLVGRDINQVIVPEALRREARLQSRRALTGTRVVIEEAIRLKCDGSTKRVSIMAMPVVLENQATGVCGIYRDLTRQWQAAERIRESEARLRAVVGNAPILLLAMDLEGRFTFSEGRALTLMGRRPGEVVGHSVYEVYADQPQVLAEAQQALDDARQGKSRVSELPVDGVTLEIRHVPSRDSQGNINGLIGVGHDVTEMLAVRKRLEYLAHHDVLTGLPNRMLFTDRVATAFQRARRDRAKAAILFMDLDHFKMINDSLGHATGDIFLRKVSRRFVGSLRTTDTVARFGGDEFAVLLEGIDSPRQAEEMARYLLVALKEPIMADGNELHASASIGISLYPDDGDRAEVIMQNADTAMYEAKKTRNNYQLFSRTMRSHVLDSVQFDKQIRTALRDEEFMLHFQPVYALDDRHIGGFEALVRWQHPQRGLLGPAEFVPRAEQNGLIEPLGQWVLRAACRQLRAWRELGFDVPRMAVNVSARQFRNRRFPDTVRNLLHETGIAAQALLIEITETTMFPYPEETRNILQHLSDMGVSIAVDDFGTGYSSLAYLRHLPIDFLKIDQSFIKAVPSDGSACAIVHTIIAMARTLGMQVIAEGVETSGQLAFLREANCDELQGFYLGRPVSADTAETLLKQAEKQVG